MKIGIDARFVGPEGTGLGKYTEKLILNLAEIDKKNEYVIFLRQDNWSYLNLSKYNNFKKALADVKWYTLEEQLKLPNIFTAKNLNLLHVPHFNIPLFYKGKIVVTIHDIIHNHFSEKAATTKNPIVFKLKRVGYKFLISKAITKSTHIFVPSNFVKKEIISTFKINKDKVTVTYEAAEDEYFEGSKIKTPNSKLLAKYNIKKPFLIYVGNAYPHKNLQKLLKALLLLRSKINLVLVCSRGIFSKRLEEQIKELGLENRVRVTDYIEAKELSKLFKEAQAYVFPSLSEGFGIPPLNAMATNLPVICSNIPVLKEVLEDAAYYFDPNDEKDMAEKISKVLKDQNLRKKLMEEGQEQVKKYSWQKMAEQTLKVYKSISS